MALYRIGESGDKYNVSSFSPIEIYEKYLKTVPIVQQEIVRSYVRRVVNAQVKFSLATAFPDPWPQELDLIWNFANDKKLSAFILAYLVMEELILQENEWMCTKTNIQDRDFESNFYWRAEI